MKDFDLVPEEIHSNRKERTFFMKGKIVRAAILVFLTVILAAMLAGCGGSESKGPSKKEVTAALEKTDCNVFSIDGENIEFELNSLKIILQDTEDGWSEVLAEVIFENKNYKAETEMVLAFAHYDKGGWVLEWEDFNESIITVKETPFDKKTLTALLEEKFTSCNISKIATSEEDGAFVQTFEFVAVVEENCFPAKIYGSYTLTFDSRWGYWEKKCNIEKMELDFDRVLGVRRYESGADFVEIDIKEVEWVDEQYAEVSYTYQTSDWAGEFASYRPAGLRPRTETFEGEPVRFTSYRTIQVLDCAIDIPTEFYVNYIVAASDESYHDNQYGRTAYCNCNGTINDGWREFLPVVDYGSVQSAIDRLKDMND